MSDEITMPDPQGRELTLEQHVQQSTQVHPTWNELDHMHYLISEVGFDAEHVREHIEQIIQTMISQRGAMYKSGRLQWPVG